MLCRRRRRVLLDEFEGVFDHAFSIDDVGYKCHLACTLDRLGNHILVLFAVACQASRHDFVALTETKSDRIEIFVVDELYFLLAVSAISLFKLSSFCHLVFPFGL